MAPPRSNLGQGELRAALGAQRRLLWAVFVFSVFANLLLLTGPLYMLQIYDRVLGSRSEATLMALTLLIVFLFLVMGMLDLARARLMARVGARFQDALDLRVFAAALRRIGLAPGDAAAVVAQRDLEAVQRLWASNVLIAIFDIPWALVFVAAIFTFHPVLGWAAVVGALVLVGVTLLNQSMTRGPVNRANSAALQADLMSDQIKAEAEAVQALGMTGAVFGRWQRARHAALALGIDASDRAGTFAAATRTFRLFLQSAMLGLGAYLVLQDALTGGAMIAASILLGRALSPIEQAIGQWSLVTRAQEASRRLSDLLSRIPPEPERTALPRPRAMLEVQGLSVVPPGESLPVLRGITFRLEPGKALGVIGPSGAGKSTLARALIGAWPPAQGTVRLDGATLDQYDPDVLGGLIGYLPQRITLFEGTIAENISRLAPSRDDAAIVAAAQMAAAHEMILRLPGGYDTRVSAIGGRLSGGQIQRIGLARALYGDPVLLVLDEPNSNLDNDGSVALNLAILAMKDKGRAVLIMAHRPAAIQECDLLLVLEEGQRRAFGPRDAVLREMVKNHTQIVQSSGPGGMT
ncbi:MAG: type I secretion system permease/ATPase [Paracoccaceae bacterium]